MKEFIICAAIKLVATGKIYYGHRHPHCIEAMNGELSWTMNRQEIGKVEKIQGFVTNLGRFVNRSEGLSIAIQSEQLALLADLNKKELYSEDLY